MPFILPVLAALGVGAWAGATTNAAATAPVYNQPSVQQGTDWTKFALYGAGALAVYLVVTKKVKI